jgi:hypothetical protein
LHIVIGQDGRGPECPTAQISRKSQTPKGATSPA